MTHSENKTLMTTKKRHCKRFWLYIFALLCCVLSLVGLYAYYNWLSDHERNTITSVSNIRTQPNPDTRFDLTCEKSQTWESDGKWGAQYDLVLYNNTEYTISDWRIHIPVSEDILIDNFWNGIFTDNGTYLSIAPVDYNREIPAGESIPIGMILYSDEHFVITNADLNLTQQANPAEQLGYRIASVLVTIFITTVIVGMLFESRLFYMRSRRDRYKALLNQSLNTISAAIDAKDPYTSGHSRRVAIYSQALAKQMNLPSDFQENIYYVALLHDIGKIGIPDHILNKDGSLSAAEFDVVKQHPTVGATILKEFSLIPDIADGARYHHEHFDGNGYPNHLSGVDIPLVARIICVADSYDAMSSKRCYRKPLSEQNIIAELKRCAGTQFDPEIADAMLKLINAKEVPVD